MSGRGLVLHCFGSLTRWNANLKGVVLGVAKITALLYFSGDNPAS